MQMKNICLQKTLALTDNSYSYSLLKKEGVFPNAKSANVILVVHHGANLQQVW